MIMNENGKIVSDCIARIPGHFENGENDIWIVMPNHVHEIIQLVELLNTRIAGFTGRRGRDHRLSRGEVLSHSSRTAKLFRFGALPKRRLFPLALLLLVWHNHTVVFFKERSSAWICH